MKTWELATDSFTFLDRLKVAAFVLNKNNQLTMGPKVQEFERVMSEYTQCEALAVSSGSTANHLIFELWKQQNPEKFKNALVIVPAVSWVSNITPVLMAGYQIKFCDVNLDDFSFDYNKLDNILKENESKTLIIWATALIGHCPNFVKLRKLARRFEAELWTDACEAQMCNCNLDYYNQSILSVSRFTSLSCYFSHCTTSIEMGFVFFRNRKDYEYGRMLRNHGMIRSLSPDNEFRKKIEEKYSFIDKTFLFAVMGTNWRNSDMHAVWGLLDMKRADKYKKHRKNLYNYYCKNLDSLKYYLPDYDSELHFGREHVAFCIPIFRKDSKISEVKKILNENKIATRPIIGSCLTLHPVFEQYHNPSEFKNALWIHNHGAYVGLNYDLTFDDIDRLTNLLNNI